MFSRDLLTDLAVLHEPASADDIKSAERALGFPLPTPYAALLRYSNGLEPKNPKYAISLFGTTELQPMAEAYEVPINLPGYLFIGSDGGCRGILLAVSEFAPVYLDTYALFMPDGLRCISGSLLGWVESGFVLEQRL